ncbi:hypothetical protein ACIGCK_04895 [Microbacterium sp. NPDC078428]|uniref:hypothetical protein n=1 Tax=Microbacterium sp. NPDC078428 TaxID=3364190 RepID=UPI0037C90DB6
MTMVKLSTKLPKEYDDNGLESNTRHLLERYTSQEYTPVVGLVRTKDVHQTEDFERVPRAEFVAIEPAIDSLDADAARELLQRLHDRRVRHVKQPLDLPDVDEAEGEVVESLAIEAADVVDAEVVDDEDAPLALTGRGA